MARKVDMSAEINMDPLGCPTHLTKLDVVGLLLKRAGLDFEAGGVINPEFEKILEAMLWIHTGKSIQYGDYIKTHGSDPIDFCLMEHYADVKRKFVRADNFLRQKLSGGKIPIEELLDTYTDLAVYGALGVQLVMHLMEREKNETSKSN